MTPSVLKVLGFESVCKNALTGKGQAFGGSAMRVEATGYELIYFVFCMPDYRVRDIADQRIAISGMGCVATHAAAKAIHHGAPVVTPSDTSGTLVAKECLTPEALDRVLAAKASGPSARRRRGRAMRCARGSSGRAPSGVEADLALTCATQSKMDEDAMTAALDAGVALVAEGANMPLAKAAGRVLADRGIDYAPGKASNAGGVAISGVETSQNAQSLSLSLSLSRDAVDRRLRDILADIHAAGLSEAEDGRRPDHKRGADLAGDRKVARARHYLRHDPKITPRRAGVRTGRGPSPAPRRGDAPRNTHGRRGSRRPA